MDYQQFVHRVQEEARCQEKEEALTAIHATLTTLAERLFDGEANIWPPQLPRELQPYLTEAKQRDNFHVDEFVQRVSRREGTAPAGGRACPGGDFRALPGGEPG